MTPLLFLINIYYYEKDRIIHFRIGCLDVRIMRSKRKERKTAGAAISRSTVDSFSGKDTSEVMYLVNSFIDKLNQKDIKSAVSMLSYLDGNDIVPLPAELVKRQCNALANAQGVKYTVDRLVFNEEKDNIVKVNILLFEKKPGDTRPNSISLYLKPIRKDNRWYLTTVDNITDSNNMGGTKIQN